MNNVSLIGRLTKDPELKYTSTGQAVTTFTLAVDNPFSKEGKADFINCVVWQKPAENLAKFCSKGRQIALVGRIQTRQYEDGDGRKVFVTEIVANDIKYLLDGKKEASAAEPSLLQGAKVTSQFDDDLPFE
jgi:single-strand DNA-binding protein